LATRRARYIAEEARRGPRKLTRIAAPRKSGWKNAFGEQWAAVAHM
jgi:hypothetical protein